MTLPKDPSLLAAHTVRGLAMDAVQAANSGHPGAPMGMADMAVVLWHDVLKYDPADPAWPDRDRVVLSNGHASMLLYSMLHLTGTSLSLDDLKAFRTLHSPTAGHPEYGEAPGIETTTGPLGQGIATGVGMAMAEKWLSARFGSDLVDHRTFVFVGDGCLMEGISSEAASLAGHLGLDKLVVIYDDNRITIDGSTDLSFSEDIPARFESMGWRVLSCDGHDHDALRAAYKTAAVGDGRPTIVCARTTIGWGSPNLAGSSETHGKALGPAEVAATKAAIGLDPDQHFAVDESVYAWFSAANGERAAARSAWEARVAASPKRAAWDAHQAAPDLTAVDWPVFPAEGKLASRKASAAALQAAAAGIGQLVGGSADLAGSNGSTVKGGGDVSRADFSGRNLHFGIREHAMAAAANGMALHGGVRPYVATFLAFHDYMRPSVRLAALMKQPVIYIYTHDSVYLGEDGPTHQPVEHLAAMRAMPNLTVIRPCDANETVEAWKAALVRDDGPTALVLTRQNLPHLDRERYGAANLLQKGGYVLAEADNGAPEVVLLGTGSEVETALAARALLAEQGIAARVVSLPSWEIFAEQDRAWRDEVLPAGVPRVSVEAGTTFGWQGLVGLDGASVGIDRFGASAPGSVVARELGITPEAVVAAARRVLGRG